MMAIPKYFAAFVFIIAVLFYDNLFALSKNEIQQNECLPCHEIVYEKGISSLYQQSPFEKIECVICHLKGESITPVRYKSSVNFDIEEPMILSSPDYLEEHTIFLKGFVRNAMYDINIMLSDMSKNTLRKEFKGMTPAKVQNIKTDDERPPVISGIKVGPIKKAIFLETTITWDTDKPSTSYLQYWIREQSRNNVSEDNTLTKHHRVTLYGLVAGKNYHLRVVSRDMFGNEVISEDMVFNTATTSKSFEVETTDNIEQVGQ
ncbi:MAG TPA: fibronectin type III domain-containing protein [Anaerolineae bacterium]|nr:fibronectin type III domain-containing protein [Anaerolineae bacterium]